MVSFGTYISQGFRVFPKSSSTANQLQYSDCILMLVMLPYPETNVLPDRCDDIMSCQDTYWMGHDLSFCQ